MHADVTTTTWTKRRGRKLKWTVGRVPTWALHSRKAQASLHHGSPHTTGDSPMDFSVPGVSEYIAATERHAQRDKARLAVRLETLPTSLTALLAHSHERRISNGRTKQIQTFENLKRVSFANVSTRQGIEHVCIKRWRGLHTSRTISMSANACETSLRTHSTIAAAIYTRILCRFWSCDGEREQQEGRCFCEAERTERRFTGDIIHRIVVIANLEVLCTNYVAWKNLSGSCLGIFRTSSPFAIDASLQICKLTFLTCIDAQTSSAG